MILPLQRTSQKLDKPRQTASPEYPVMGAVLLLTFRREVLNTQHREDPVGQPTPTYEHTS